MIRPIKARRQWLLVPILLLLGASSACQDDPAVGADLESVVVKRVVDGDTVELSDGRKIRYIGVDTPEISHSQGEEDDCFGQEARIFNEALVLGKTVELEYDVEPKDRYGRTLAYVWLVSGSNRRLVAEELIRKGYGKVLTIPPNDMYLERLEAAEELARSSGAGLWSQCP